LSKSHYFGSKNGVQTQSQSYNAANQVIGWSYDAAGNLLSDGTHTSAYDALSRQVSRDGISYAYNGDGVLVQAGATAYTLDLAAPLSQVLHDGSASYVYGSGAERLRATGGDWYIPDALGSVRATLDASGNVLASTSYDPWGLPQASAIAPFGFTGEVQDAAGMVYLRARWYDAGSGTFTSHDPFEGFPTRPYSLHPYQYGYSSPLMYVDPSGEQGEYPPWVEGFRQCSGVGPKPPICNWWPWGKEHFVDELEEAGLDATQDALDTVGLVPGAGEPADALNASISLLRGDTRRALLSCAAIIPLAGWGPTAAKHLGLGLLFRPC
jgi:RHS repeat-associated protein